MKLSLFGQTLARSSGIVELMEDLGDALNNNPALLFLGGGNPAHLPRVEDCTARHLQALCADAPALRKLVGVYQSPQGHEGLLVALAKFLTEEYRWPITSKNIALTNGSQTAFYILLNLFGGRDENSATKQVVLPLVPEYLGYANQGAEEGMLVPTVPSLAEVEVNRFKYAIDFQQLKVNQDTAALCISRPTNPSGNMVSDDEVRRLAALAKRHEIPLIIDGAYGNPFPGLSYVEAEPFWDDNTILVLSLSKLGMPGLRTGIVVACEEVIQHVVRANTVISLANGNPGPMVFERLLSSGDLVRLTQQVIRPFYLEQRNYLLSLLDRHLAGLPYCIHQPEGAFFLWLWLRELPVSSAALYHRLKGRNLLVMAGEHFFFGLEDSWPHGRECIRLTYCADKMVLERAAVLLAETVRELYEHRAPRESASL